MSANGTELRSSLTHHKVTAVAAFPDGLARLLKHLLHLHVGEQSAIAVLMRLLDLCNGAELISQLREALFLCFLGKGGIHIGPFVVLALGGGKQVVRGVAKLAQRLEPELCVLLLVVGGLLEDLRDLLIATTAKG